MQRVPPGPVEDVRSFGRCAAGTSSVQHPASADDVKALFREATASNRRVVVRGGGHSFGGQAVHDRDTGLGVVLCTDQFTKIGWPDPQQPRGTVRMSAGASWRAFLNESIQRSQASGTIELPGTMQTGGAATAGGTLAGDCLSRFSATQGKESAWIESFRLITPGGFDDVVSRTAHPDLFHAAIGGHGYIGFATDIVYRLRPIPAGSRATTNITVFRDLATLVAQLKTRSEHPGDPDGAVSSAGFTDLTAGFHFKGGIFESSFAPLNHALPGFALYQDLSSSTRYASELAARIPTLNWAIHEALFLEAEVIRTYQNDLDPFLFFMDGNTNAKKQFEHDHPGRWFPIVQQTFVIPDADDAAAFARYSLTQAAQANVRPTEFDILYVQADDCLLSATYKQGGFAVSLAFEPETEWPDGCPPAAIDELLSGLSDVCWNEYKGRIHLVKNAHLSRATFRDMFNDDHQLDAFEAIKRHYDPDLVLQNPFSDRFLDFGVPGRGR